MPSTPRRKPVSYHRAAPLFGLAAPLLALLCGACLNAPAGDGDSTGTDGSSGDVSSTQAPTTGDDTGAPALNEGRYFLRIDDEPVPPVRLEMDRDKTLEVFGEEATKQIKLLDVDSTPLLAEVLSRLLGACGDDWQAYQPLPNNKLPADPKHDCSKTELGLSFGADWKNSPQFQMVRLLTMTPRNARVGGTVLNDMEKLFRNNENNFGEFSFQDVLAASMFCPFKDGESAAVCTNKLKSSAPEEEAQEKALHVRPFLGTDVLASTLKATLMASHPNIANDQGLLPVTLYDALMDMQPLSEKFGPVGDHPGLLMHDDADGDGVDEFKTRSDALTDQFKMTAVANSNLRLVEGVDASVGAGSMFISTAAAPLAFDFLDEDKVQLLGIAPNPTVDMRMRMMELDGGAMPGTLAPVPSCDGSHGDSNEACKANLPDSPLGEQYAWSQPLWSLEYIIAHAAYSAFATRQYQHCFIPFDAQTCLTDAKIGLPKPTPDGWTVFTSELVTPKFPAQQYFWEMLLNVAQQSLHDYLGPDIEDVDGDGNKLELISRAGGAPEIAEGKLNPIFALKKLSIGLTAEQMIAQIRPNLQAQAEFIAKTILGKFWKHNDHLDFYYRRGSDGGAPILFFVAETDLRPDPSDPEQLAAYSYAKPGFFADAALTTKLSSTTLAGVPEADHEKLALSPGESTVYMQDDAGDTYALRFYVPPGADPTEIVVHVRPV